MKNLMIISLVSILFFVTVVDVRAQEAPDPLAEGVRLYEAGQFQEALERFESALAQEQKYSGIKRLSLYKYTGLTYLAFSETEKAVEQFYLGLRLNEAFSDEPEFAAGVASPKVKGALDRAIARRRAEKASIQPAPKPPETSAAKPDAAYIGRIRNYGIASSIVGGAGLVASGVFYGMANARYADYKNEMDKKKSDRMEREVVGYNRLALTSGAIGIAAGGLGAYFLVKSHRLNQSSDRKVEVLPYAAPDAAGVLLLGRF